MSAGKTSPPISTLIRIANAINVKIVDFFVAKEEPIYILIRKGKGQIITQSGSQFGYSYEGLALEKRDKNVEPFLLTINPNDPEGKFHHSGQEFIYMLSGCMDFTVNKDCLRLKAGDSLYFDSSYPHKTQVVGKRPAKFLCVFIQDSPIRKYRSRKK